MKETILMLSGGLIAGMIIMYLRNFIINKLKKEVPKILSDEEKKKLNELFNANLISAKVMEQYGLLEKKEETKIEAFSGQKLTTGMLKINNGVLWAKDIASIFNLRKLIIIGVIIGIIFGYGYYKGKINKPVQLVIDEAVEFTIPVPNSNLALYHPKHSTELQWINLETGKVISIVKVKDIPELAKKLKSYGFVFEPIFVAGGSLGETGAGFEAGAGLSWFKWFKAKIDSFITNRGLYPLGFSYGITDNSGVGIGAGIGYKGDKRVILYYKWRF
jgi:hypothetical protein